MATIKFIPLCSSCGNPIIDIINISQEEIKTNTDKIKAFNESVHPSICSNCGAHFDSITIPTKLPFDNSNYSYDLIYEATKRCLNNRPIQQARIRECEDVIYNILQSTVNSLTRKIVTDENLNKEVQL